MSAGEGGDEEFGEEEGSSGCFFGHDFRESQVQSFGLRKRVKVGTECIVGLWIRSAIASAEVIGFILSAGKYMNVR